MACTRRLRILLCVLLWCARIGVATLIDWGSIRCPTGGSFNLPTPTYGTEKAVFGICSQVSINAPPAAVYRALLDFKSYPRWNSFVVNVTLPPDVVTTPDDMTVNTTMKFTTEGLIPGIKTTSTEIITALDEGVVPATARGGVRKRRRQQRQQYMMVAWRSDDGLGGLLHRAEHPTVLVDQGDGTTLSVSYEPYYAGLLTLGIAAMKGQLQKQFQQQNLDLKAYVEATH